jgi:hypothetical protein
MQGFIANGRAHFRCSRFSSLQNPDYMIGRSEMRVLTAEFRIGKLLCCHTCRQRARFLMDRRLITVLLTLGLMWNLHGCASSPSRKVARTRQDSSLASCNETQGKTVTSALHERANQISISDRRPVRQISNQDEASELLPHSHTRQ